MFKFKLVNHQKCLDNMKINGILCSPKLGDSAEERYRSVSVITIDESVSTLNTASDQHFGCSLSEKYQLSWSMTKLTNSLEPQEKTQISLCICAIWWACKWQNQHNDLCTKQRLSSAWASTQSDQNLRCHWVLSYTLSALRRLWSDWADAQADLSLCWAHMSFCRFSHTAALIRVFSMGSQGPKASSHG